MIPAFDTGGAASPQDDAAKKQMEAAELQKRAVEESQRRWHEERAREMAEARARSDAFAAWQRAAADQRSAAVEQARLAAHQRADAALGPATPAWHTGPLPAADARQMAALGPAFRPQDAALSDPAEAARRPLLGPAFTQPREAAALSQQERLAARVRELDAIPQAAQAGATYRTTRNERAERDRAGEEAKGGKDALAIRAMMQGKSDEWSAKPIAKIVSAGQEFYSRIVKSAEMIRPVLETPLRYAESFGIGKANPNAMGQLSGAVENTLIKFATPLIPLAEKAAKVVQDVGDSGVAKAAGSVAGWMGSYLTGGFFRDPIGMMTGGERPAADAKKARPSMAGLPQATLGGMEDWYDRALLGSLQMGTGTQEAERFTQQVENMSKTLGGLLVDIRTILANQQPSFRGSGR